MPNSQPNILIITTDQQRTDSLSCYGSQFTSTPNIDRLAREGVRLDRAYCTNPVCTPSRVSLFTGKQVSRHGAWNVGVNCSPDETMLSHLLGDASYHTHYIGKAHFEAFGASAQRSRESRDGFAAGYDGWHGPFFGFQSVELALGHATYGISGHYGEWVRRQADADQVRSWESAEDRCDVEFGGNAYDWSLPLEYHNSVWTADRTVAFLEQCDRSQPFLLAVGFQDPHHPHAVPVEFSDRVDPIAVPLPDYVPGELDDKPPHFQEAHEGRLAASATRGEFPMAGQGSGFDYRQVSEEDARRGRAYYYTMVRLIDQQMGRILDTLDALDLADNTLVFFTSDHGELLGDHGLWMKGPFCYEELIRVPTLVRWPKELAGGRSLPSLFSLVDIAPTCLAAAGVNIPADMDGIDATPMLRGDIDAQRQDVLVEFVDNPGKLRGKTIVSPTHKLTWYAGQTYGELYDLVDDPAEKVNCWNDPAYAAAKSALLGRLLDYQEPLEIRSDRLVYA